MPFPLLLLLPFLVMFTGCPCSWSRFYNHLNLHATTTTKKKFFNDFDWPVPASFLATPWHRFSKAKKMPSTITTPPGVLCQVDSKIKITDQWSENIWTFLNLEWLCKNLWTISLMMWFLPTLKGSQPYKVPTQPSTRVDHPFILLHIVVEGGQNCVEMMVKPWSNKYVWIISQERGNFFWLESIKKSFGCYINF